MLGHVEKKLVSTHRNLIKLCDAVEQINPGTNTGSTCMFELPQHATLSEAAAHPHTCYKIGVSVTGRRSWYVILKHAITPII